MYNTQFQVKYHDIKQELLQNINNLTDDDNESYTEDDINTICSKLFIDELTSVFYASELRESKVDYGMKYVYDKLCKNVMFLNFIKNIENELFNCIKNDDFYKRHFTDILEDMTNLQRIVIAILFSEPVFYITHRCICQAEKYNNIDESLLDALRNEFMITLNNYTNS